MAFKYTGSLTTDSGRTLDKEFVIGNTKTIQVGDFVTLSSGYIQRVGTTASILGLCTGFVVNDGTVIERADTSSFDGTFTASSQTYLSASDNVTDKKVRAVVIVDPFGVFSGPNNATLGDTTGSGLPGYYSDVIADSDTVNESTSLTTTGQLFHLAKDPENTAQMLYMINEHMLNLKS